MADLFRAEFSSRESDRIVRRHPFGFVDVQDTIRIGV
jgi:hypothetical protein